MKFLKELGKGKLAGHPIHVMIVHFPLALFPVSLLFDFIYYKLNDPSYSVMSFYCLVLGTAGGYIAAVFGMVDLVNLVNLKKESAVMNKAMIHAGVNTSVILFYTILVALRYKQVDFVASSQTLFMVANLLLNIMMIVGAHYGGDLIFRHKVGVVDEV
jgi:uncharacterized membrane protein